MYQVFLTKQSAKECRKRGTKFKKVVAEILHKLANDPSVSERLTGELHFIYSYHFNYSGTAYRLAYTVNEKEKILTVVLLGLRENFYKTLKRKLG